MFLLSVKQGVVVVPFFPTLGTPRKHARVSVEAHVRVASMMVMGDGDGIDKNGERKKEQYVTLQNARL